MAGEEDECQRASDVGYALAWRIR